MPPLRASICVAATVLTPATALPAERFGAEYALSWRGLEVGRFETRVEVDDVAYRIGYAAETVGIVGWLFPFMSAGASEGVVGDPGLVPARHVGESRRRDGQSDWLVRFDPDGAASEVEVTNQVDEKRDPVPPAMQRAPDPLSLALQITGAMAPGAKLEQTAFDGKRAVRFELECADEEEVLADGPPEPAGQTVLRCTLDGDLMGGRSRRWASTRDDDREPAVVLLSSNLAPGRYWPVRIVAGTRFGPVVIDLTDYR
jgi:hypothetical protein